MQYWGVVLRGVDDRKLSFKEHDGESYDFCSIVEEAGDGCNEVNVTLPNKKSVPLSFEFSEDGCFFGFFAGYPWEESVKNIEEKDVDDAIVKFLSPFLDMKKKELRETIEYISTYNCG